MKKATRKNFSKVLDRIKEQFLREKDQQQGWLDSLNNMLDDMRADDFFGTEGQNDPRGDQRIEG